MKGPHLGHAKSKCKPFADEALQAKEINDLAIVSEPIKVTRFSERWIRRNVLLKPALFLGAISRRCCPCSTRKRFLYPSTEE
jgi:hypothetical protein